MASNKGTFTYAAAFQHMWVGSKGKVVRIPGTRGFVSANSQIGRNYIQYIQHGVREMLSHDLPAAIRKFFDDCLVEGNMPWDTGNLRDSFAAALVYLNKDGNPVLYNNDFIYLDNPMQVAIKKQHWGVELGGKPEHLITPSTYRGFGYSYAAKLSTREPIKALKGFGKESTTHRNAYDSEGKFRGRYDTRHATGADVAVFLYANVPYATAIKGHGDWMRKLTDAIRDRVSIVCDRLPMKATKTRKLMYQSYYEEYSDEIHGYLRGGIRHSYEHVTSNRSLWK